MTDQQSQCRGFTLHCGYCGMPARVCACKARGEMPRVFVYAAAEPPAKPDDDPPPTGWRDRPPLL